VETAASTGAFVDVGTSKPNRVLPVNGSRWLRFSLTALLLTLGCTHQTAAPTPEDDFGEAPGAEDGSTAGCTSRGGACVPYTQACPPPQQNTVLCENTILLCCLPPGQQEQGGPIVIGEETDGGMADDAVDVTTPTDSALTIDGATE
jgi:hypothetical protein